MFRRVLWLSALMCLLAAPAWAASHMYAVGPAAPATVSLVARGADELVARVDVPSLQWGEAEAGGQRWDVIAIEDFGVTSEVGAPLLPVLSRLVEVGATEGVAVEARPLDVETIGDVRLLPFQPAMYRDASEPPPFTMNEDLYSFDEWLPAETVQVGKPVIIHGQRFVPVSYYPVQYNPARETLRVARAAELIVTGGRHNPVNPLELELPPSAVFAPMTAAFSWRFDRDKAQATPNFTPEDGAILVIVADDFMAQAQVYVDWKTRKGLPVEVLKTSEITGAGQNAQEIKKRIRARYNNADKPPLDYVLLIGDYEFITTFHGIYGCASDSMYVTLEGDDYFPDTIVGRLPVKNVGDAKRSINKMVNYEQSPDLTDPSWFLKGMTVSSSESQDNQNATFCGNILEENGYTEVDYFFQSTHNNTNANVAAAFNEGRGWVSYFGHGSGTAWASVNPYFTNANVKALTNTGKLPVITDISCDNGHFDKDADCFAEVWIKTKEDAGAAGIFSASRSTPFGWTDYLGRGVAVGHFNKGFLTFGGATYFGKIYMFNNYPQDQQPGGQTEEVIQHYLIFGDPELNIWSDTPAQTAVDLPTALAEGKAATVSATVTINGAGLERALVHLWVDGGVDLAARTGAQGKVSIELGALSAGDVVNVMVTGPNALAYETTIEVTAPPPADDDDDNADDDDATDDDDNDAGGDDDASGDDDDDDSGSSGGCS